MCNCVHYKSQQRKIFSLAVLIMGFFHYTEDKKFLRVFLPKGLAVAENLWNSLLVGQYETDAWTFDQMEKKATLQKYQQEVTQG